MFVFYNENPQIKLAISSSDACISIEESRYVDSLIKNEADEEIQISAKSTNKFRYQANRAFPSSLLDPRVHSTGFPVHFDS